MLTVKKLDESQIGDNKKLISRQEMSAQLCDGSEENTTGETEYILTHEGNKTKHINQVERIRL